MSAAANGTRKVDHAGLKVGQAVTIGLLLAGFIFDAPAFVAFVAVAQLAGALDLPFAPYRVFYRQVALPLGWVKPNVIADHPEPHRFALIVGTLFNGAAVVALLAGAPVIGWALVWVVIVLANLNFWLNFCAGCWMYYALNRLGVPGFTQAPLRQ